jgi:hypothetical protein
MLLFTMEYELLHKLCKGFLQKRGTRKMSVQTISVKSCQRALIRNQQLLGYVMHRGVKVSDARSPCRQSFVQWRLIFMDPQ